MNASIVKAYEHGDRWVVGVSGGKDSSATCLYLLKHGLVKGDFERVFLDNGWEYPQTYEYIETLSETIGEIKTLRADIKVKEDHVEIVKTIEEMLGRESPFIRVILNYTMFPTRYRKMCTERTKLFVLRDYYKTFEDDPLSITGIRREESRMRAKSEEFEWNKKLMCYTWKPILDWTTQDVVDIHKHFGLAPNPLYLSKYDRVSCYPCIFANKSQIRNIGEKRRKIILSRASRSKIPLEKSSLFSRNTSTIIYRTQASGRISCVILLLKRSMIGL